VIARRASRRRAMALAMLGALAAPPVAAVQAATTGSALVVPTAAPPPGNVIRVKGVAGDTVLALVPTPGGGLVSLTVMARLLGGALETTAAGRQWRLALYGTSLDIHADMPFVGYNGFTIPLHEAVQVHDGAPHAPLQLFSEIVPRFGIGIIWDKSRWEVRLFQGIARRPATAAREGIVPATPVATVAHAGEGAPQVVSAAESRTSPTAPARQPQPPATAATAPATAPAPAGLSRRYTIAVDAGHGGHDPGNPGVVLGGERINESKLTLGMALNLEHELRTRGFDVVMTRKKDTLVARDDRGPMANARKADMFLSLHTNAYNPRWRNGASVRGFETYFLATARTEDERRVAEMENDVVRFEKETEAEKGDPLAFILNDLAQNEHLRESSDLAQVVQDMLAKVHPGPNRGVKQAGFAVLARSFMPAVLIEVGFGTNIDDVRWMASAKGQADIAMALADAVEEYLRHYERRARTVQR